jgi:hypothetical protein
MRMGATPDEALARSKDEELIRAWGFKPDQVKDFVKTGEPPVTRIPLVKEDGFGRREFREPLGDRAVRDVLDEPQTVKQATKEQALGREALAQDDANWRAYLAQQETENLKLKPDALEQVEQQAREAEATQPQPEVRLTAQPSTQPAQPDPVVQQAQAYGQLYQRLSQMTHQEHIAAATAEQWRQWPLQKYAELRDGSGAALLETQRTNPSRFAQIQSDVAKAQQQYEIHEARWSRLGQERQRQTAALQQHQQRQQAAAIEQRNKHEDEEFSKWLAREHPEHAKGEAWDKLRTNVRDMLRSTGATDAEITNLWRSGAIRANGTQRLFVEAALWRQAQARMRDLQSHKVQPPPVQRPGTYRPRGAGDDAEIATIEKQLPSLKGRAAIDAATRAVQLRRKAGRL